MGSSEEGSKKKRISAVSVNAIAERDRILKIEGKFLAYMANISDAIVVTDAGMVTTYVHPAITRILGYTPGELIGHTANNLFHPDEMEAVAEATRYLLEHPGEPVPRQFRMLHKDGRFVHLEVTGENMLANPAVNGCLFTIRDMTERKRIEEDVQKGEEKFRAYMENISDAIAVTDAQLRNIYASPSHFRMLGYSPEELVGQSAIPHIHPGDVVTVAEAARYIIEHPCKPHTIQFRARRKDNIWIHLEVTGENLLDNPAVNGLLFTMRDITERKKAEETVRKSEGLLRKIIDQSPISIALVCMDGTIEYLNRKCIETLGYLPEDVPDMGHWWPLAYPDETYRAETNELWTSLVKKAIVDGGEIEKREYMVTCKDRTRKTMAIFGIPVEGKVFVMFYDLTEIKRAQEELRIAKGAAEEATRLRIMAERDLALKKAGESMAMVSERDERLKAITASIPGVVYQFTLKKDGSYAFPYVSESVAAFMGLDPKKIEADPNTFFSHIPQEEMGGLAASIEKSRQTMEKWKHVFRVNLPVGGERWFQGESAPYLLPSGDVLWAGVVLDVTRLKEVEKVLRESEERLQAVMDNAFAVIYVKDPEGRYVTVNRQYEKLFGVTRNVIAGKTDYDIFPKEAADAFRANDAQVITTGEPLETEEEVPQTDGVHTYISIKFPLRDAVGRVYALCGISTDITDRKKAEEVLKTSHEKLENLVRARTADLMEVNEALIGARNKAEKATKAKDKFINLLSHDLKSPLSSLSLILDMLLADKANPPPENQKTLIQKAKNRMRSLVTMIEDLLRMSNIQSEGMEPKKRYWDLRSLIMHNIDAVEEMAVKKGVTVKNASPAGIQVFVDMRLISQVILNLLSNAIKFSRDGGVITVSGGLDGGVFFTVKDNGVGIDPVILPEIFNREVRTTTLGTDGEVGTGFGLPFCMDIVERHGGTIEARSVPGEGSEFTVRIPEVKFLALVVDDQEVARKAIIGQVRKLGMEALEAENGAQALSILAEVTPNLVITDLSMPEMNGFELLKKIRSGEVLKSIPVIVATSSDDAESQRRAFELGADDFIAKPVSESDLLPRVKRLMERGKPLE